MWKIENMYKIAYNTWNGYNWGKNNDRRTKVNNWLNEQKPDIVAFHELCDNTPGKLKIVFWVHHSELVSESAVY